MEFPASAGLFPGFGLALNYKPEDEYQNDLLLPNALASDGLLYVDKRCGDPLLIVSTGCR